PPSPLPHLFPYTTLFRSARALTSRRPAVAVQGSIRPAIPDGHRGEHHVPAGRAETGTASQSYAARLIPATEAGGGQRELHVPAGDRKSTRLNSSHEWISY